MTMNESVYNIQLYKKLVDLPYAATTCSIYGHGDDFPRSITRKKCCRAKTTDRQPSMWIFSTLIMVRFVDLG